MFSKSVNVMSWKKKKLLNIYGCIMESDNSRVYNFEDGSEMFNLLYVLLINYSF